MTTTTATAKSKHTHAPSLRDLIVCLNAVDLIHINTTFFVAHSPCHRVMDTPKHSLPIIPTRILLKPHLATVRLPPSRVLHKDRTTAQRIDSILPRTCLCCGG